MEEDMIIPKAKHQIIVYPSLLSLKMNDLPVSDISFFFVMFCHWQNTWWK